VITLLRFRAPLHGDLRLRNCPDVRNTKIVDVVAALTDYGITVNI
jgi:hypothetical protein